MKKQYWSFICTAFMFVCLFSSCQSTPDEAVISEPVKINATDISVAANHQPVVAPSVVNELAAASTADLNISFEAQVHIPDVDSYSIYEVQSNNFSDAEIQSMFYSLCQDRKPELFLEPDYTKEQWMIMLNEYTAGTQISKDRNERISQITSNLEAAPVVYPPTAFSFDDVPNGHQYSAYFRNKDGLYGLIYATKNGNDFCYLRDAELFCYRQDVLHPYQDGELLKDYEGDFPVSQESARKTALKVLEDLGLSDMQLINTEKLCTYKFGKLVSKGWDFVFAHGADGLPAIFNFASASFGGENLPLPTLCSPWGQEAALISVDEQGVICVDLRNIVKYNTRLLSHVELISFEQIKTIITEHLGQVYRYPSTKIKNSQIKITNMELCSSLVNAKDDYFSGHLIPSWLVSFEYIGNSNDSYIDESGTFHEAETFVSKDSRYFSAIDGSYIEPRITKDMLK